MHDRNLRLFLQSQAGLNEISNKIPVRVQIPGEYVGTAILMGQHTISRSSSLIIRNQSHQPVRYYDPSHDGQRSILSPVRKEVVTEIAPAEVVEEELNLQGFQTRQKAEVLSVFADIGMIVEDDNVASEDEEPDTVQASNSELNSSNVIDPETMYAELVDKDSKNFGISRLELAAFNLTQKQVKALYTDVTGKNAGTTSTGKLKSRIRAQASNSYSDYTRVMMALKKVIE